MSSAQNTNPVFRGLTNTAKTQNHISIEVGEDSLLYLVSMYKESADDDGVLAQFAQDIISGETPDPQFASYMLLQDLVVEDLNQHYNFEVKALPIALKPKYDAVRAQLEKMIKLIDQMKYSPDA